MRRLPLAALAACLLLACDQPSIEDPEPSAALAPPPDPHGDGAPTCQTELPPILPWDGVLPPVPTTWAASIVIYVAEDPAFRIALFRDGGWVVARRIFPLDQLGDVIEQIALTATPGVAPRLRLGPSWGDGSVTLIPIVKSPCPPVPRASDAAPRDSATSSDATDSVYTEQYAATVSEMMYSVAKVGGSQTAACVCPVQW